MAIPPAFNEKKSGELWFTNSLELHVSLFYIFGELWSTNKKDLLAHIDQPTWTFFWRLHKCTFWGYHISAVGGGCYALKFLHALDIHKPC